jgi:hypothetical protein
VLKLSTEGYYMWHTFYGSATQGDSAFAIARSSDDNLYISGYSQASWGSTLVFPFNANDDILLLKLDSEGNYLWNGFRGCATADGATGMVEHNRSIVIVGDCTCGWLGYPAGEPLTTHTGGWEAYIWRVDDTLRSYLPMISRDS